MRLIANPRAGRGRGSGLLEEARRLLESRGVDFSVRETAGPGNATELASEAVRDGCRRIVVLGGDGTVAEAANGLLGSDVELGVISVGTGNDLARSLGLPYNNLASAIAVACGDRFRRIDVGRDQGRYFVTALGMGYPALVAEETNRSHWLKGPPAFFFAVYKALNRMKPVPVRVTLDDREFRMACTSILIHNTSFTGGGLKMAPDASVEDGLFDVVLIDTIGRLDLMLNFPKVYSGSHLDHPHFHLYRTRRIRVESEEPMRKMCDGDPAGWSPVEAEVVPAALKVLVPA